MKKPKKKLLIISRAEPFYNIRSINREKYETYFIGVGKQVVSLSRFCKGYISCRESDLLLANNAIKKQINDACRLFEIDLIVPQDGASAFCVAKLKEKLIRPIFPSASYKKMTLLNNKWKFAKLLRRLKVPLPETVLVEKAGDFKKIKLSLPIIVKPLSEDSGRGIKIIEAEKELLEYKKSDPKFPFIAQKFIRGHDFDLSMFAKNGEVGAWTMQKWSSKGSLEFINEPLILDIGRKIIISTKYTGLAHFDMRIERGTKKVFVLECNPRMWGSINASLLAGVDFIQIGIEGEGNKSIKSKSTIYEVPGSVFKKSLKNPFYIFLTSRITKYDMLLLAKDPLPYAAFLVFALKETLFNKSYYLQNKLNIYRINRAPNFSPKA